VIAPDPDGGSGNSVECNYRPAFERALCQCVIDLNPGITKNGSVVPPGHQGDSGGFTDIFIPFVPIDIPRLYVCGTRDHDMWNCAKVHVSKLNGTDQKCIGW
jgi:hypothetical protein